VHLNWFIIICLKRFTWNVPDEGPALVFRSLEVPDSNIYTLTKHIDWDISWISESLLQSAQTDSKWGHGHFLSYRFHFLLVTNKYFGYFPPLSIYRESRSKHYAVKQPTGNDETISGNQQIFWLLPTVVKLSWVAVQALSDKRANRKWRNSTGHVT
jgi:hypothetical protein